MKRVWCIPKGKYVMRHRWTGEIRTFSSLTDLREWWSRLSINDSLDWRGWNFD